MRIRITLPVLMAVIAAPATAQTPALVYHGTGYDVVLPVQYKPAETTSSANGDEQVSVFKDAESVLFVGRFLSAEIQDTSLATRRAFLQISRVALLEQAGKDVALDGEPRDFERGDRIGMRITVTVPDDSTGQLMHGVTEVSIARDGPVELWMVMYLDKRDGNGVSTGERVLDSFRITGAPPEEQAFHGRGFRELTDRDAKPRP